jgi:SAM-dependent methyltransferase
MNIPEKVTEFTTEISDSLREQRFIKLSLGNYKGADATLKNIYIKKVLVRREENLSFTYRHKTRDITKNYIPEDGIRHLAELIGTDFHVATLQTTTFDLQFEIPKNQVAVLRKKAVSPREVPSLNHDKDKKRLIPAGEKPYLQQLGITDEQGNVFKNAQDKYRQINHYIELLSGLIAEIPSTSTLKVADMGSGKGYLTFALYDYLQNVLGRNCEVTGVEFRNDLVQLCNSIAQQAGFNQLRFVEGTIESFDEKEIDILIALHACDTATDDAIWKGIAAGSSLIVVAPCCHKQIRREIEKHKAANDVQFLTRYGIFLERQAEMVTDGIRALILEYFGYKTKVFQFVSDVHTPKNVMVVGVKDQAGKVDRPDILEKIKAAKKYFGISYHHLERIAGIEG